mmetsp:Transcript_16734/g.29620  ORF Transcript_16734/g.29620 Transcript_16734/m.29620 type:complete len:256 (+) Transcript_16734:157-924(+)
MWRITPKHVGIGVGVYIAGTAVGVSVYKRMYPQPCLDGEELGSCQKDKPKWLAFERLGSTYDDKIGLSERLGGILGYREKLVGGAEGKTLEVAAGTGRNIEYYPKNSQVTFVDLSDSMLQVAREKARKTNLHAMFALADCTDLPFEDNTFDNVVDTFGLCSFSDPVAALREMKRVCKPGGHIRLLEHGKSAHGYSLVNTYLDKRVDKHVERWGCWWNRDISEIVEKCGGLTQESEEYHHFGTTYALILRKPTKQE